MLHNLYEKLKEQKEVGRNFFQRHFLLNIVCLKNVHSLQTVHFSLDDAYKLVFPSLRFGKSSASVALILIQRKNENCTFNLISISFSQPLCCCTQISLPPSRKQSLLQRAICFRELLLTQNYLRRAHALQAKKFLSILFVFFFLFSQMEMKKISNRAKAMHYIWPQKLTVFTPVSNEFLLCANFHSGRASSRNFCKKIFYGQQHFKVTAFQFAALIRYRFSFAYFLFDAQFNATR